MPTPFVTREAGTSDKAVACLPLLYSVWQSPWLLPPCQVPRGLLEPRESFLLSLWPCQLVCPTHIPVENENLDRSSKMLGRDSRVSNAFDVTFDTASTCYIGPFGAYILDELDPHQKRKVIGCNSTTVKFLIITGIYEYLLELKSRACLRSILHIPNKAILS